MIRLIAIVKKTTLSVCILLLFQGCSSKNSQNTYQYADGIEWYLTEAFNMDLKSIDDDQLLFINISCVDCMVSKVSFLELEEKLTKDFKIIFLGDTVNNDLVKKYRTRDCEYDLNSKYSEYETGIYLPLYLKVHKGEIVKHSYVSDENMTEFVKMLYETESEF